MADPVGADVLVETRADLDLADQAQPRVCDRNVRGGGLRLCSAGRRAPDGSTLRGLGCRRAVRDARVRGLSACQPATVRAARARRARATGASCGRLPRVTVRPRLPAMASVFRDDGTAGIEKSGSSRPRAAPVAVRLAVTTERTRGAGAEVRLAVAALAAAFSGPPWRTTTSRRREVGRRLLVFSGACPRHRRRRTTVRAIGQSPYRGRWAHNPEFRLTKRPPRRYDCRVPRAKTSCPTAR